MIGPAMKTKYWILALVVLAGAIAMGVVLAVPGQLSIAQAPLFTRTSLPPLNMLVMARDHKLYYEAYNDASDLDNDGALDVGYKPDKINYYGYYRSDVCYASQSGVDGETMFVPVSAGIGPLQGPVSDRRSKQCDGTKWSGDFLNYVTTSRMDALRKVLYGGYRYKDKTDATVLQASYTPQDAHSWGKEYQSMTRDGYDLRQYTPYNLPDAGRYTLFAITTLSDNGIPQLRVLNNTTFRIWNWVSIERPVAGDDCFTSTSARENCVTGASAAAGWQIVPSSAFSGLQITTWRDSLGTSNNKNQMDTVFNAGGANTLCIANKSIADINTTGANNNPGAGTNSCTSDNYHTLIKGKINITQAGQYKFAINGDDAIELTLNGSTVGWYGGHGANATTAQTDYTLTLDLAVGSYDVQVRQEEGTGDDNWQLYWIPPATGGATAMTNYPLRVQACPTTTALREDNCKVYGNNTSVKPTGILHDYGETDRMYFGLLSGSYKQNMQGGVVRKNISSFSNEVNTTTGQFITGLNDGGIVDTIDKFRIVDFHYGGSYSYGCGWITTRPMNNNSGCWMWGNPIGEMMYETLRYYEGATTPKPAFDYTSGWDADLKLPKPAWKPPYTATASGGMGYAMCAQPTVTILSDINPSYDFDVPGSHWSTVTQTDDPAAMRDLDVSAQVDAIWAGEGGGSRKVFIGESNGVADSAPTPKTVSNLSTVRGLSPEEPSKQGTFYTAGIARYGAQNNIGGDKKLRTYSVALASPLPKFSFPVGNGTITFVPFAKSVGGSSIDPTGNFQPTDQIVDFYVQTVKNTDPKGGDVDPDVNGGRPYAEFRINYEDVEQGADHDMDAISLYTLQVTATGQLQVDMKSEYAAGGIDQYMGYVISGTTADGVYLEVHDRDGNTPKYKFATPPGRAPGYCDVPSMPAECAITSYTATRTFNAGTSAGAGLLENPLWYAAKYGTDQAWDANNDGTPDNYFLVTNPLYLKQQLSKAFDTIEDQNNKMSGSLAISGAQVSANSFVVLPSYSTSNNATNWVGNLEAFAINADGTVSTTSKWKAASKLPATTADVATRKIYTALATFDADNKTGKIKEFIASDLGANDPAILGRLGYTTGNFSNDFGTTATATNLVDYLRGVRDMEGSAKGATPFRPRTGILGDIINSAPVIATKGANYGWSGSSGLTQTQRTAYTTYVNTKSASGRKEYVFVGANDGMLHAFNEDGNEVFAYVPNAVQGNMGLLANRDYAHHYYVDGKLTIGDALIGGNWKTLLVGGMGAGGKGVFGMSLSGLMAGGTFNQDADILWELNAGNATEKDDIGYVMGKPQVVATDSGDWVAIFGNGYNSTNGNAVLYVVDLATGKLKKKIVTSGDDTKMNGLGNIVVVDGNGDGLVDTVYGGDLQGHVWKFDLSGAVSEWDVAYNGQPLFTAKDSNGKAQPITGGFDVAVGPGIGYMVYFGTGRYFVSGDNDVKDVQSVYGIWDNTTSTVTGRASLVQQSITSDDGTTPPTRSVTTNSVNYLSTRGWYMDLAVVKTGNTLDAKGERMIGQPVIQNSKVYFPTYIPGVGTDCIPGGINWLYALNAVTGGAALGEVTIGGKPVGSTSTGGISTGSGAPGQGVGVAQPTPTLPSYCDPADPTCTIPSPGSSGCSEVIIDPIDTTKSIGVQRACGRQSWRQLK